MIADLAIEEAELRTMGDTDISRSMGSGPITSGKNGGVVAVGRGVCTLTGTKFPGTVGVALLGTGTDGAALVSTPLAGMERVIARDWGGGVLHTERLEELKLDKDESVDSTEWVRFRALGSTVEAIGPCDGCC